MTDAERSELEQQLAIVDCNKGDVLLHQGVHEMEQYFVLDGILKRVVTNAEAKEMILRFADERDIETSYAAWRLNTPTPYSIVCVTKARVAKLPMPAWVAFLDRHPKFKAELRVRGDAPDERDHGAHHHAAPARRARARAPLRCASTPSWSSAFRRRNWPPTSTSRPRR